MRFILPLLLTSGLLGLICSIANGAEGGPRAGTGRLLTDVQNNTDQWIELERRIADEQNQWETDREILSSRLAALQEEQASLRQNIESFAVANQLFDANRVRLEDELSLHRTANEALEERLAELESRIQTLRDVLPDPLLEELAPLLRRLDPAPQGQEEEEKRSAADRAQSVTAILAAISRFGNSINLTHTIRPSALGGPEKDIRVLYWGLSFAFASDVNGSEAWFLRPSPGGWTWEDRSDQALRFKALVDIYEKQKEPELVTVPVRLGQ